MSQFDEINDVKASIRAVLSSSQTQLTINDLSRDYQKFDGSEIPFRKCGYRSLLEFLRSIPDVVMLQNPNYSNSIVHPVSDGKTAHIDRLVTSQKLTHRIYRPKRIPHFARNKDTIPYELKKDIWRILSAHPEGIPRKLFDEQVNRMLYQSLINRTVEDVIEEVSNFTYISNHRIFLNENAKRNDKAVYIKEQDVEKSTKTNPSVLLPSESESDNEFTFELDYSYDKNKKYRGLDSKRKDKMISPDTSDTQSETSTDDFNNFPEDNPILSKTLIKNLRLLLEEEENQNGIWACQLANKYLIKFGYELSPKNYGFDDIIDMVARLPEVFKYRRYRLEGDYLLEDARKIKPIQENKEEGDIPVAVINDLKKLLSKRNNHSLYTDDLPREYKRFCQKTLRPEDYGFENMDQFLKHLEYSGEFSFRRVREKVLINLSDDPVNDINDRRSDKNDALLNVPRFNPLPEEVCQVDFKLDTEPFLDSVVKGQKVLVNIAEVYTPGKFYLHLASNIKKLDRMMEDLNAFYKENGDLYEVLATAVNRGLLCACPFSQDSKWHRVSIVSTKLTKAKAKFIDYGTMEEVSMDKLRYLHRDFSEFPPLAIRSKLAGIQPKKNEESGLKEGYHSELCHYFYEFASSGILEAEVVEYDAKASCLVVFLNHVKESGERICINEELIKHNLVDEKGEKSLIQHIQLDLKVSDTELKSVSSTTKSKGTSEARSGKVKMKIPVLKDDPFLDVPAMSTPPETEPSLPLISNATSSVRGPPPGLSLPSSSQPFFNQPLNLSEPYFGTPLIPQQPTTATCFGPSFSVVAPPRFNSLSMPRVTAPSVPLNPFAPQYQRYPSYSPFDYPVLQNPMYFSRPSPVNIRPPPGLFHPTYYPPVSFSSNSPVHPQPQSVVTEPLYQCQSMYGNDPSLNNNAICSCKMCLKTTTYGTSTGACEMKADDGKLTSACEELIVSKVAAKQNASKDSFKFAEEKNASIFESIRERMGVENEMKKIIETGFESSSFKMSEKSSNFNSSAGGSGNSSAKPNRKKNSGSELSGFGGNNESTSNSVSPIRVNESDMNYNPEAAIINGYCDENNFSNKMKLECDESTDSLKVHKEKINPIKQFVLQCQKQATA